MRIEIFVFGVLLFVNLYIPTKLNLRLTLPAFKIKIKLNIRNYSLLQWFHLLIWIFNVFVPGTWPFRIPYSFVYFSLWFFLMRAGHQAKKIE